MNPLTRQELQSQLQQTTNILLARFCTKQEIQNLVETARQRILERVATPLNELQIIDQKIDTEIGLLNIALNKIESKLENLQASIDKVQHEPDTLRGLCRADSPRTVLEQMYA